MSTGALPGFRDCYPDEFAQRARLFAAWRAVARRYGFQEYDGPPLEPLELYTQKSGDEIVGQLFDFVDKGGRHVALRPEMTPTVARMVAARANALRKPVRWFSIPQLFRYERTQKGRLREHFQLNVDIFGASDELADAELLAVAVDIQRALGLTPSDVRARVSDRRVLTAVLAALGLDAAQGAVAYAVLDKIDRQPRAAAVARLGEAGVPTATAERLLALVGARDLAAVRELLGATHDAVAPFERYLAHLEALGVSEWVVFDLAIVRGLAYYTGIVFELFDARGEFRAICGGGRYDGLLAAVGGPSLPAVGFGMGDVVLGKLLEARGLAGPGGDAGPQFWVATDAGVDPRLAMRVAARLRAAGFSAQYELEFGRLATKSAQTQIKDGMRFHPAIGVVVRPGDAIDAKDLRGRGGDAAPVRLDAALVHAGPPAAVAAHLTAAFPDLLPIST
jgi:histidyl-tRNA synthetase